MRRWLRAHGDRVIVTATPSRPNGWELDPAYHVPNGGDDGLAVSVAGPTRPVAHSRAASILARDACSARVGPLERGFQHAGDPSWGCGAADRSLGWSAQGRNTGRALGLWWVAGVDAAVWGPIPRWYRQQAAAGSAQREGEHVTHADAQREAEVEANRVRDHLTRDAVAMIDAGVLSHRDQLA